MNTLPISLTVWLVATTAFAVEPVGPALNPAVTQATIAETICTTGWTRTVRPYVADMKRIKAEMLAAVGEKSRIDADAAAMIADHSETAYWLARDRALELRLHKIVEPDWTSDPWDGSASRSEGGPAEAPMRPLAALRTTDELQSSQTYPHRACETRHRRRRCDLPGVR
jgi:hypothetical protein